MDSTQEFFVIYHRWQRSWPLECPGPSMLNTYLKSSIMDQDMAVYFVRNKMETFSALLDLCAGHSPVPGEFPTQRSVARSFDVFSDLRLNKCLSKHSRRWWLETPSRSLWHHFNSLIMSGTIPTLPLEMFSLDILWSLAVSHRPDRKLLTWSEASLDTFSVNDIFEHVHKNSTQ